MPTIQKTMKLLPKQMKFATDRESRGLLYSGAFGAGKTRALCIRRVMRASIPGAREALIRKHLTTLKGTTLRTLLEPDGDLPPVLPEGSYRHNKMDKIIRLNGGGEIIYFAMDDPQKVGSHDLTGIGVDEAVEFTEEDWIWLRGRNRRKVEGLSRCIDAACNPGSPSHFLAKLFGLAEGHQPLKGYRAITTNSFENFFLPDDYLDDISTFTGLAYRRYVLGEWAGSEGLVYDAWDRHTFVRQVDRSWKRCILAVDVGYRNPSCVLPICETGEGIVVPEEWYERRQPPERIIEVCEDMNRRYKPEVIVVDPSAAGLIASMRNAGLPAVPSESRDVFGGIQTVQDLIVVDGGVPRLSVDPKCSNVIMEFETYEWKKKKDSGEYEDKPVKHNDHAMDALRYGVVYLMGAKKKRAGVI